MAAEKLAAESSRPCREVGESLCELASVARTSLFEAHVAQLVQQAGVRSSRAVGPRPQPQTGALRPRARLYDIMIW
jgi:hypothetical protein